MGTLHWISMGATVFAVTTGCGANDETVDTAGAMQTAGKTETTVQASPGAWREGKSMPVPLGEVAGGIIGNTLYVVGEGETPNVPSPATLALDLGTGEWKEANELATRKHVGNHHTAEVIDGRLFLFGGLGPGSAGTVQIYDPVANEWSEGARMPFAAGSSSSAKIGGLVYVVGGIIANATTNLGAVYDPAADTWREIAPMPHGRNHAAGTTDGKSLWVIGGRGKNPDDPACTDGNCVSTGFGDVQVYDPGQDRWKTGDELGIEPLEIGRGGMGRAVFRGGAIYVMGGETSDLEQAPERGVFARVDILDLASKRWRDGAPMRTPRHGIFPVIHANEIYVAGGGVQAAFSASDVLEIYKP